MSFVFDLDDIKVKLWIGWKSCLYFLLLAHSMYYFASSFFLLGPLNHLLRFYFI